MHEPRAAVITGKSRPESFLLRGPSGTPAPRGAIASAGRPVFNRQWAAQRAALAGGRLPRGRSPIMKLDYVPLLRVQRDLHGIPIGRERFREYLRTILNDDATDVTLPPLVLMNPMGKGHVAALLDALLALDADGVAARTAGEAADRLADEPGECKLALVVADDLMGGGTNRYDYEFTLRFGPSDPRRRTGPPSPVGCDLPRWSKACWLSCVLWTSEAPSERAVREAVLTSAYRVAYA